MLQPISGDQNNLYSQVPIGLCYFDRDLRYLHINEWLAALNGRSVKEHIGRTLDEVVPGLKPILEPILRKILETGEPVLEQAVNIQTAAHPGVTRNYLVSNTPVFDTEGKITGISGVVQDITERVRIRCILEAIIEGTTDAVFGKDREGHYLFLNSATAKAVGKSAEELLGKNDTALFNPEVAEELMNRDQEIMNSGKAISLEEITRVGEEQKLWSSVKAPMHDASGQVIGVMGISRDITALREAEKKQHELELRVRTMQERRRFEEKILATQKFESLGVLAGGIAHDFNNLLVGVLGYADLAQDLLPKFSPAQEMIEEIVKSGKRAAELCDQMLAYAGKGKFEVQAVDLNALIRDIYHLLEISTSKNAELKSSFSSHLPAIEADATQLRQVVMNLVINASEAIGEKQGVISLRTGVMSCDQNYLKGTYLNEEDIPEGQYVYLEVSDSGEGMSAEAREKIFDPFFTTKFTGRGLGLAAVMGITRSHKGAIKVDSVLGEGSTFKVFFPSTDQAPETLMNEEECDKNWRGSGVILLVDDDETMLSVGRLMLEGAGFQVLTAADGVDGLDIFRLRQEEIICVILDFVMPRMDGPATYRELRKIDETIPILLSSGYNEQELATRFSDRKLCRFLKKPYKASQLIVKLRELLSI
ncbi:MAG: PAS domain-containing protein [Planctomycetota bacterium]|nr:PAS domain-containing protein [Planctomycetota bacterium]